MEHKLITTFKEYKETYQTRLENHLAIYDDFDELHFINSELDNYKICLRTSNIKTSTIVGANGNRFLDKTIYSPDFVNSNNDTTQPDTGLVWQVYKLIRDEKFNLTGGYDIEKSKRLNLSFTKIIEFLQEKEIICDKINEYQSNFLQPDSTIIAMLDGIETSKVDNDKIRQSEKYLYLKETAKEYAEKYNTRLTEFLNEFEADEIDYIEKEVEYFESTLYDVQNSESSHDGYATTGFDNFSTAYLLVMDIGFDKFMYSTKAKLTFLANKKDLVLPQEKQEIQVDFTIENNLSDTNAVQKIIYLNELGLIDFLRNNNHCFGASVNNLANLISAITGEKNVTIQPYLNKLIYKTGTEKQNPYKTNSTVQKVKNQLIKMGVKP